MTRLRIRGSARRRTDCSIYYRRTAGVSKHGIRPKAPLCRSPVHPLARAMKRSSSGDTEAILARVHRSAVAASAERSQSRLSPDSPAPPPLRPNSGHRTRRSPPHPPVSLGRATALPGARKARAFILRDPTFNAESTIRENIGKKQMAMRGAGALSYFERLPKTVEEARAVISAVEQTTVN